MKIKETEMNLVIPIDRDIDRQLQERAKAIGFAKSQICRGLISGFLAGVCDPFAFSRVQQPANKE